MGDNRRRGFEERVFPHYAPPQNTKPHNLIDPYLIGRSLTAIFNPSPPPLGSGEGGAMVFGGRSRERYGGTCCCPANASCLYIWVFIVSCDVFVLLLGRLACDVVWLWGCLCFLGASGDTPRRAASAAVQKRFFLNSRVYTDRHQCTYTYTQSSQIYSQHQY
jgi:hypothetical protein